MATLVDDISKIVGALGRVFREEGRQDLADLFSNAGIKFTESSYDNWNGGTYGYTLQLEVTAATYAKLGSSLDAIESDLQARIQRLTRLYANENVESVIIAPNLEEHLAQHQPLKLLEAPSFWADGAFRLFLSHISDYKVETSALAESLSRYGISAFVAHEDIEPTKEWEDEIRVALATCDALVCLLTPGFNASKWTDQEVGFVVGRGALIIPVRLGLDPYGFMGRYQGFPGTGKSAADLASGLVPILARHQLTKARMADGLVLAFEQSRSYATAKARVQDLELIQTLTPELVVRIQRAVKENSQISAAHGVPGSVARLIAHPDRGIQLLA